MTAERYIIITLSLTVAVLLAVIFWPVETVTIPVDPQAYAIDERIRLRDETISAMECELDSMVAVLNERPKVRRAKRAKIATQRQNENDSIHAALLHERIK